MNEQTMPTEACRLTFQLTKPVSKAELMLHAQLQRERERERRKLGLDGTKRKKELWVLILSAWPASDCEETRSYQKEQSVRVGRGP